MLINGTGYRTLRGEKKGSFSFFNVIIMLLSIKSIFSAQQRKGNHQFLLGCTEKTGNNKSGEKEEKGFKKNTFMEQYFFKWVINIWLVGVGERRWQLTYRHT